MNDLKLDWNTVRLPKYHDNGVPVFSFGEYYPTRSSNHGAYSRKILDFKNGEADAIRYFSQALSYMFARTSLANSPFYTAVIPPSEQGAQSVGFERVLQNLSGTFQIQNLGCNLFNRTETKEKSHRGGSRSLEVHLRTMAVEPSLLSAIQSKGAKVLILDDVTTTGNSIKAAIQLLREVNVAEITAAVAFAKTV